MEVGLPTAPRYRNSPPCCASPACCPQSRSCQTASRKGAGSSLALREEADTRHSASVCVGVFVSVAVTLTDLLRQRGELVDVLTRVLAAGHAKAKLEIKALEQLITKVVSLDHAEVVDGCFSHRELHSEEK